MTLLDLAATGALDLVFSSIFGPSAWCHIAAQCHLAAFLRRDSTEPDVHMNPVSPWEQEVQFGGEIKAVLIQFVDASGAFPDVEGHQPFSVSSPQRLPCLLRWPRNCPALDSTPLSQVTPELAILNSWAKGTYSALWWERRLVLLETRCAAWTGAVRDRIRGVARRKLLLITLVSHFAPVLLDGECGCIPCNRGCRRHCGCPCHSVLGPSARDPRFGREC